MVINVSGKTDIGRLRELNEDNFTIFGFEENKPLGFCILSDGMGGHNAGEVASTEIVNHISQDLSRLLDETDEEKIVFNLTSSIDFANNLVYNMSTLNPQHRGMGATCVIAYVKDEKVWFANVGDSRAYLIADGTIEKITSDHSVVEELVKKGTITPEEARFHPDKNIITRAVGTDKLVNSDIYQLDAQENDTVLLCSDGLYEMITDEEILEIISSDDNLDNITQRLIDSANEKGGRDNITVVLIRFA